LLPVIHPSFRLVPMATQNRFGPFRLDLQTGELFQNGDKVPLQDQPFQILKMLLEHPGEVISREEIRKTLWSDDTIVEFDNSVHAAIKKLRLALGDSAESPVYVETLPRKGYRFIFPPNGSESESNNTLSFVTKHAESHVVFQDLEGSVAVPRPQASTHEVPKPRSPRSILWGIAIGLVVMTSAVGFWLLWHRAPGSDETLIPVPLITQPGFALDPSLSPDGNEVAFTWAAEKGDGLHIYIKQIGSESLRRLTTEPQAEASAAWSPDGQFIAFLRYMDSYKQSQKALMLIPANGGRARQIAEVRTLAWAYEGRMLSWHPGGKWLALPIASMDGTYAIYLVSTETGEKRRLTSPPRGGEDGYPAFSPDGRKLVFSRRTGGGRELYLLQVSEALLPEGDPTQLTFSNRVSINPTWMPDGKEIIYASGSQSGHCILWRISASGSEKPRPLPFSSETRANRPAVSLQNRRLVYISGGREEINIQRFQIPRGKAKPSPPTNFMISTRGQGEAEYSPDGKAVAYHSFALGSAEIWVCDRDGTNPMQLTHLGGPSPDVPRWSPDSRDIAFCLAAGGQRDLFRVPAQGGQVRPLTNTPFSESGPSYSRDGKWIYFVSDRGADSQIWKIPVEGGEQIQVTRNGGSNPQDSMDGKILFYLKPKEPPDWDSEELWSMELEGGAERRVLEGVLTANFDVKQRGVYYAHAEVSLQHPEFLFHDFATGKTKRIATIDGFVWNGFSVSPDEQSILFTQSQGEGTNDLMIVENFR
jgi:Tol biopolymer transport system component/DNA-binding winged helix-turn-helix (wHTH) protein